MPETHPPSHSRRLVLELARSLREQVDWEDVRKRTSDSAFAKAYFTLLEELGIV